MTFEEWWGSKDLSGSHDLQKAFTAGAASRDAEIAELVADATRYRVLANSIWYIGPESFHCGEGGDLYGFDNKNITKDILDAAVDVLAKVRKP